MLLLLKGTKALRYHHCILNIFPNLFLSLYWETFDILQIIRGCYDLGNYEFGLYELCCN